MHWKINWDERSADELKKLDRQAQRDIIKYLNTRVASSEIPQSFGKPFSGTFTGLWRYGVGDYRLICLLNKDVFTVLVLRVGHRKNIYH
ncbi:MAG: type II toxin-antitoxin system RelE/ParE family toxin [Victivallales bacterium]